MSLADLTPEQWLKRLISCHDRDLGDLKLMDAYYEGTQPLSYLAPEVLADLEDRLRPVIINWPQLVVDSLEERLDIEGFRFADSESAEDSLWEIWQANDMDEGSQQAHVDALTLKRSYAIVGTSEDDDIPLITAESALEVYAERDPATRKVVAAIKLWEEPGGPGSSPEKKANLYLPDARIPYTKKGGVWTEDKGARDDHRLGQVLVVPLANRPRLRHLDGTSELRAVIPISDAACKIASDMMVSAEYHAMPRRWATGLAMTDFADTNGQPMAALSALAGRLWTTDSKEVTYGQFPEAQLSNFHATIDQLARLVASLTGLPPHFLGLAEKQPPSADAIRASEARLVKRAERRQRSFGEGWERVMRLCMLLRDGEIDPRARRLETIWRDPATPTYAQKADAVTKLHQAGILPDQAAWEELGYSAEKIKRLQAMQDEQLTRITAMDLHNVANGGPDVQPGAGAGPDGEPGGGGQPQPAASAGGLT